MEGRWLWTTEVIQSKDPSILRAVQPHDVHVSVIHPTSKLDVELSAGTNGSHEYTEDCMR